MNEERVKNQWPVIQRGAEEIIGANELQKKISKGKKLRVKFGADPTAPDLHLGHTVVMEKLKAFQELGHTIVFIIGDFTAMIGDPSGRTAERPVLTKEEIEESVRGYEKQIFKILERKNVELVRNSKWLSKLGSEGVIRLASNYTVAQMLERNDFSQRYSKGNPISITEFLYPLLQGYDSVEVKSDIEIGGTDQKFNLLVGREMQRNMGQEPQAILTMPLLEGTDGIRKMSKSYGNHIGIDEPPGQMYGKIMSISDEMMYRYYTLLTNVDVNKVKSMHPKDAKAELAERIVAKYHGEHQGKVERQEFDRVHSRGGIPNTADNYSINEKESKLIDVIYDYYMGIKKIDCSKTKLKKELFPKGAVKFNGEKITDINYKINSSDEGVVQVGSKYPPFKIIPL